MRMKYLGVSQPAEFFGQYRQMRRDLAEQRQRCFPLKEDWQALDRLIGALDAAAVHFTGVDNFYGGRAEPHSLNQAPKER